MKLTRVLTRATLAGLLMAIFILTSLPVWADQAKTPQASAQTAKPATSTQAASTPSFSCPYATNEQIQRMQEMHEAMLKAKTPQERAKLREQQWQLMHEGMGTVRRMSPMAGGMRGAAAPGAGKGTGTATGPATGMGPGPGMGMGMGMGGMGMGPGMMQGACIGERMAMMEMMMQMMMDRMEPAPTK